MIKSKIEIELEKDKLSILGIKDGFIILIYNSNKLPLILYAGSKSGSPAEKSIDFLKSFIETATSIILRTTEEKILFREKDYTYHCDLICNLPNDRFTFPASWDCLADKRNPAEQLEIALELLN
ncbi:MAG TPA: hypothetical protein P5136_02590 [Methanofastidiosum sp.]|nr:hypothetical protein [Methanofastidiosum sp.]